MKKKLLIAAMAGFVSLSSVINAFAGQWQKDEIGWWYQNDDGSYIANNWLQENGKSYYFDANGYMVTGWLQINGTNKYYYFNKDGSMRTAPLTVNGVTYNFDEYGVWTNDYNAQLQAMAQSEALRIAVQNSYYQNYNQYTYSGVNMGNEVIVSYHDVAQDR